MKIELEVNVYKNIEKKESVNAYILLTKREVKMAGYWPSSLYAF